MSFSQKWKNYRLTDWFTVTIAGFIFVAGYFLAAMSWRKGTSAAIVWLDFMSGSAGFAYCFYKCLKIVSETHEELLAMTLDDHLQPKNENPKCAPENDYVLGETVFNAVQETKLQVPKDMCRNSPAKQTEAVIENLDDLSPFTYTLVTGKVKETQYKEFKMHNKLNSDGNILSDIYANFPIAVEPYAEISGDIRLQTSASPKYSPENVACANFVKSPTPGVQSFLRELDASLTDGFATAVGKEASEKLHYAIQSSCKELSNEHLSTQSNYFNIDYSVLNLDESFSPPLSESEKNPQICSLRRPLERFKSVSEQNLNVTPQNKLFPYQQRIVHSSTTDNLLTLMQDDFSQHYQKPKSLRFLFDSSFIETPTAPDPGRHLKPLSEVRKPLPSVPDGTETASFAGKFHSPMLPSRQFHTPAPPVYQLQPPETQTSQFLSPMLNISQLSSLQKNCQFQSPLPLSRPLSPHKFKPRTNETLTRQQSHPMIIESRSPPNDSQFSTSDSKLLKQRHLLRHHSVPVISEPRSQHPYPWYVSPGPKFRYSDTQTREMPHVITLGTRSPPRVVQSPPPRSRPSPPYRTLNTSGKRLKRSPPSIPRKNVLYK